MIKTYEEYGRNVTTYSVGDYLLIDLNGEKVKVISTSFTTTYDTHMYVELSNGESKNINIRRCIYRKLYPAEIKEFQMEKETDKYNL